MVELLEAVGPTSLVSFLLVLLVFGFAPGFVLRIVVLLYPKGDDRRRELVAELYVIPRLIRPVWVAEQIETALFEGLKMRIGRVRHRFHVIAGNYREAVGRCEEWTGLCFVTAVTEEAAELFALNGELVQQLMSVDEFSENFSSVDEFLAGVAMGDEAVLHVLLGDTLRNRQHELSQVLATSLRLMAGKIELYDGNSHIAAIKSALKGARRLKKVRYLVPVVGILAFWGTGGKRRNEYVSRLYLDANRQSR